MEEHKQILKEKYEEGKILGERVRKVRVIISQLKTQVIIEIIIYI